MAYASEREIPTIVWLQKMVVTTKYRWEDKFSLKIGTEGTDCIYRCGIGSNSELV
jgi:hypothetical protein